MKTVRAWITFKLWYLFPVFVIVIFGVSAIDGLIHPARIIVNGVERDMTPTDAWMIFGVFLLVCAVLTVVFGPRRVDIEEDFLQTSSSILPRFRRKSGKAAEEPEKEEEPEFEIGEEGLSFSINHLMPGRRIPMSNIRSVKVGRAFFRRAVIVDLDRLGPLFGRGAIFPDRKGNVAGIPASEFAQELDSRAARTRPAENRAPKKARAVAAPSKFKRHDRDPNDTVGAGS